MEPLRAGSKQGVPRLDISLASDWGEQPKTLLIAHDSHSGDFFQTIDR